MTAPLKLAAICCTLRRPAELANALACFLAQDYPADRRELIILDDDPNPASGWQSQRGDGWQLIRTTARCPNLGAKHNMLADLAGDADALVIWDDDDIYAPWHLRSCAAALGQCEWSAPSRVWSNYGKSPSMPGRIEDATGRFHGAWAVTVHGWSIVRGWPETDRQTFDQEFGDRLRKTWGRPADPCAHSAPSYCYRWNGGNVSGLGVEWVEKTLTVRPPTGPLGQLVPRFDDETRELLRLMGASV